MPGWDLPTAAVIGGISYEINTDYRDVLDIIRRLSDPMANARTATYVCLALFYNGFESMPQKDYEEAAAYLMEFINCGEVESNTRPHPKTIDWEQDRSLIVADVNKVAGCEVRALPYLHWWTFISYFNGIGDGQLSVVVSIREKLRKGKKLDEWERDFYRQNKTKIDFKRVYTSTEDEILNEWLGK